jgi:hypothetical protein
MKIPIALALASLGAAALVAVGSPALASTAPVQHSHSAAVEAGRTGQAIAIPLAPGTHKVSMMIPAISRPFSAQAAPSAAPQIQVRVGKNNCAGYNGQIVWGYVPPPLDSWYFETYGTAWDDCGVYTYPTQVFIYISYTCFNCIGRVSLPGITGPYSGGTGNVSEGIPPAVLYTFSAFGPSAVEVTACLKWNTGWGCGAPQSV